ncbi:histidine kinase CKI1-like isoform X2 [Herrania umbratica]|uniref:histidine kinase n=1 Tax=Herrania umbratica TaxID=108875 RepID=A0A6J1A906_9ROSI|nr:histidine kinase CKI1-like isoform X2 [Herrania umbratica]
MKSKLNMQKHCPKIIFRPACSILILGVCGYLTLKLCMLTKQTRNSVMSDSYVQGEKSFLGIEATSRLLLPLNTSALNLARSLSSILNGTELPFVAIQTKIAPVLFVALSTIPHLAQISYIGLNGLIFSYYNDKDQKVAVFSNTSFSSNWYSMPVNRDTGMLYGEAVASKAVVSMNESWFQESLNRTNGYCSLGKGWNNAQDSLFFTTVAMDGRGVVSVGFPAKVVIDHFAALDFNGGDFHLATAEGDVIVQTRLPNTEIVVQNSTVSVQSLRPRGHQIRGVGNVSCVSADGKLGSFNGRIMGEKYTFYCSTIEIAGVPSVYVLAYPSNKLVGQIQKNSKLSLMLLKLMFISIVVAVSIFIFFTIRAAKREMFLCAALVKQMNSTQQAERKSMFKTQTYLRANHDIRSSLAAITTLLDLCHDEVNPASELAENLAQTKTCAKDLLGILNSVLKMSKIEAGKMDLEEEEFNLAQLLEDVVDMFYPLGIKKGIDVVLDPCDGSIGKLSLVRGDRVKLKQILCNLLSNAIKYTSEGHVSVRAVVKKRSFEKKIIASNGNAVLKCLSQLFCKTEDYEDIDALHRAEQNLNKMEFEFEVDDTGKGIPKDKQASIYEEFFQVKETALAGGRGLEEEGCGLGLGIVQSIVRLMDGEIGIVEKEPGERGTCFRFTVLLTACQPEVAEPLEDSPNGFHPHFSFIRNPAARSEGSHSHVILCITGEERKRVLKRYIENLYIKVTLVKQGKSLHQELEKIKRKLDFSHCNHSGKPDLRLIDYLTKSASNSSDSGASDPHFGIKEGSDSVLPQFIKSNSRSGVPFTVVVIDSSAGNFSELCSAVASFRTDIPDSLCKVVWLDNPVTRTLLRDEQDARLIPPCDHLIYKPFHGSRLTQVLHLLPERKGPSHCNFPKLTNQTATLEAMHSANTNRSKETESGPSLQKMVIQKTDGKRMGKPLKGKKFLVVEDDKLLRRLTVTSLEKLGAEVEVCINGKEALDEICKNLREKKEGNSSQGVRQDYIIMDCEMPVMDGYEATRLIRMEEERYGVHVPIIAVTAHAMPEEANRTIGAGMDFHLTKPLQVDKLLEVIQRIDSK